MRISDWSSDGALPISVAAQSEGTAYRVVFRAVHALRSMQPVGMTTFRNLRFVQALRYYDAAPSLKLDLRSWMLIASIVEVTQTFLRRVRRRRACTRQPPIVGVLDRKSVVEGRSG